MTDYQSAELVKALNEIKRELDGIRRELKNGKDDEK